MKVLVMNAVTFSPLLLAPS